MSRSTAPKIPSDEILSSIIETIRYDLGTGQLSWLRPSGRWGQIPAGAEAGYLHNAGYRQIKVGGKKLLGHRVAWFLHYGIWPKREIDHRDGDPLNNRIDNLREASHVQNLANRNGKRPGKKGITQTKHGTWVALIVHDGSRKYLGTYKTPEAAHAAYMKAATSIYGEFVKA